MVEAGEFELLFPDQPQEPEPPWLATPENLIAIDWQFWDWTLWASSKAAAGKNNVIAAEIAMIFDHLIAPLGAERPPASIEDVIHSYQALRRSAEARFGVKVPRRLEREVLYAVRASTYR